MKSTLVQIWNTRSDLERSAVNKIFDVLHKTLSERSRCCIALSGGETPKNIYHQLGRDDRKRSVNWNLVHIFFCDERAVPPDNPQSNFGMADREFLSQIAIPSNNVHRIKGELDPGLASHDYEQELKKIFMDAPVIFDLILLGLGEDGHTASIFPGSDEMLETKALVKSVFVAHLNSWRTTLTFQAINSARMVVFLVSGSQKAGIVKLVLGESGPDKKLPASMIQTAKGSICWMIDKDAALHLKERASLIIERE
jgi:6-phosphogluconolactonase